MAALWAPTVEEGPVTSAAAAQELLVAGGGAVVGSTAEPAETAEGLSAVRARGRAEEGAEAARRRPVEQEVPADSAAPSGSPGVSGTGGNGSSGLAPLPAVVAAAVTSAGVAAAPAAPFRRVGGRCRRRLVLHRSFRHERRSHARGQRRRRIGHFQLVTPSMAIERPIALHAHGVSLRLRSGDTLLISALRARALMLGWIDGPPEPVDLDYAVVESTHGLALRCNDETLCASLDRAALLEAFDSHATIEMAWRAPDRVFVHPASSAGAVRRLSCRGAAAAARRPWSRRWCAPAPNTTRTSSRSSTRVGTSTRTPSRWPSARRTAERRRPSI